MAGRILVLGDLMNDVVVVPRGPIELDTDTEATVRPAAGGSAANTAAWAGSVGAAVDFVGCAGAADADHHAAELRAVGVEPHLQVEQGLPTGTIVILVDGEQRSMLTERGANAALRPDAVSDELLAAASVVHVSGYTIVKDHGMRAAQDVIRRAFDRGIPVSVTPGSHGYLAPYGVERFLADVAGAEILLPSYGEGRLLAGVDDPRAIVSALLEHAPTVVLTLGSGGALVAQRGTPPVEVPVPRVDRLVDPTGAGDAFAGAFLAHWVLSRDAVAAARAAVLVAARAVMLLGGRPPA